MSSGDRAAPPSSDAQNLAELLGPRGDLSTALATALHEARTRASGSHEVVAAITEALNAMRVLRRAVEAGSPPSDEHETPALPEQEQST